MLHKLDLHIHTPVSSCYQDHWEKGPGDPTSMKDVIAAAARVGLDAIVGLDHNTAEGLPELRRAADGTSVTIFPGVEVTASECHTLAIFDPSVPTPHIEDFVKRIGFGPDQSGIAHYNAEVPMLDLFGIIEEYGGLAIAAHVDRWSRGFAASYMSLSERRSIFESPHLSALEITSPQDKIAWNSGSTRYTKLPFACTQSSDAHHPTEVGRRPILIDVPTLDLASLRLALHDHTERLWFPHELESATT